MKIFISHASANKDYGNTLVELLRAVGVKDNEIIFTSNNAYGIPIGQNIFHWLKSQIIEKPFVIYLLSKEYYTSIACLNEMGAAWIIENEHAILFVSGFEINSKEFQNGAIDPREIGFFINDEEKILAFIHQLEKHFEISKNNVLIHQNVRKYISAIKAIDSNLQNEASSENKKTIDLGIKVAIEKPKVESRIDVAKNYSTERPVTTITTEKAQPIAAKAAPVGIYDKFIQEATSGKLKDEELILLHYVIETSKTKLSTGWQEQHEIDRIKSWEEVYDLNNTLSSHYDKAIRKFELRGYTEVSALTSSNNPKEVSLKNEISSKILDLPQTVLDIISSAISNNKVFVATSPNEDFDLPF